MKRMGVIGVGASAVAGVLATAAVFLDPRGGGRRRHAVAETGKKVARSSAHVATMMGSVARRGERSADGSGDVRDALQAAVGDIAVSLEVVATESAITVRGEVDRLSQIAAVSRVLAGLGGGREVVNLVRLHPATEEPVAAAG